MSLGRCSIGELWDLFHKYSENPKFRTELRAEMQRRKPSTTELLRQAVNKPFPGEPNFGESPSASKAGGTAQEASSVVFSCVRCKKGLRLHRKDAVVAATCPNCKAEYNVQWIVGGCVIKASDAAAEFGAKTEADRRSWNMTLEQAYKIVGASPRDPWDPTIKTACRALMQQYHPDKCVSAPVAVQKLAEVEFKLVNRAYEILKRERGG